MRTEFKSTGIMGLDWNISPLGIVQIRSWVEVWNGEMQMAMAVSIAIVTDSTDKIFLNEGGTLNPVPVWSSEESAMSFELTWADVNRDGTAGYDGFPQLNGPNRLYLSTSDKDSDFLSDTIDDFRLDPTQESDKDGDGYGDNTMGAFDSVDGVPGTSWRNQLKDVQIWMEMVSQIFKMLS